MRPWRTAWATSIGTAHVRSGVPCQDAAGVRVVGGVLVAAVSDGAGTARHAEAGSALAVAHFLEWFAAAADPGLAGIDRGAVDAWFGALRGSIGEPAADYACTLLGAVVGPERAAYVQIGDGAIVVGAAGAYDWVFWPQHGEYANSTYFVTQEGADRMLQFTTGPAPDEIALFSDGIERLVLDMAARTVHGPAFEPIFAWLAGTAPEGDAGPSAALAAYLGSEHVNRRTDDDKALAMATRV